MWDSLPEPALSGVEGNLLSARNAESPAQEFAVDPKPAKRRMMIGQQVDAMANPEHLKKLNEGPEAWNNWVEEHRKAIADLSDTDLSHRNLSGAHLVAANLKHVNLTYARLIGVDMSHADLEQATLNTAYLPGATFSSADLRGADLRASDLSFAHLDDANLNGADLRWADLNGTTSQRQTSLTLYLAKQFSPTMISAPSGDSKRLNTMAPLPSASTQSTAPKATFPNPSYVAAASQRTSSRSWGH